MGARRVVLRDRRGGPSAAVTWRADGALERATVRIPDRSWVSIEPRAAHDAIWGAVDRLWHGADPDARDAPLTVFAALDWTNIDAIPPLAEPIKLPSGAGTAILNLIAQLAQTQGVRSLPYRGPYPTEMLFTALLECFRPEAIDGDILARFMANDLRWAPAPFTPSFEDSAYVQWRDGRVEKVVWNGRAYYRETWGAVRRRAPLRVHDVDGRVHCSLWALGTSLAHHLILDPAGVPRPEGDAPTDPRPPRLLTLAVRDGLVALVIALSAPPLARALHAELEGVAFTVGPVAVDLVDVGVAEIRVAFAFARALRRALARAVARDARAQLALAALTELATAMADPLRARAQSRVAREGVLSEGVRDDVALARAITAAVGAMLDSGGVDDQPRVEGDEGHDRYD